jgi:HEAT repeat protein
LSNENKKIRIAAAEMLGYVGTVSVVGSMIESIKTNDKVVSEKIGDAIGRIIHAKYKTQITNYGNDYKKWKDWYNTNKKWFESKQK